MPSGVAFSAQMSVLARLKCGAGIAAKPLLVRRHRVHDEWIVDSIVGSLFASFKTGC